MTYKLEPQFEFETAVLSLYEVRVWVGLGWRVCVCGVGGLTIKNRKSA